MDSVRVSRLALANYKSVEKCELSLEPLTVLVGRNGVGKSNLVDALRFIADALRNTLEHAIRERGGIREVRRRVREVRGRPLDFELGVELRLPDGARGHYEFEIATVGAGNNESGFRVKREECTITQHAGGPHSSFAVVDGKVTRWSPAGPSPAVVADRLYLVAASGDPAFRPVYDILTRMTFHNFNPEQMRVPQKPSPGHVLLGDGSNLASVIKELSRSGRDELVRVRQALTAIGVPVSQIRHRPLDAYETIELTEERGVADDPRPLRFGALALSDGTLRALAILVSLASARVLGEGASLIGVEEPETALHPSAAGALMDALVEGSERTQLLITCHSPDLLEHPSVGPEMIRPVISEDGVTQVGILDRQKKELLTSHLSTAGELLRLDQLQPDIADLGLQAQGGLFADRHAP